ncbi:MAG: enoyl-CoA hydratase/isomerase family protein, partial [Promethearchaeota archaeon]
MTEEIENKIVLFEFNEETGIATITLNRPEKRNAINYKMFTGLSDIVDEISGNKKIRVVLLRAAGEHFSAGIDFNLLSGQDPDAPKYSFEPAAFRYMLKNILQPIFTRLASLEKPTIAIVDGMCIGSGYELILACDFRYATKNSYFQLKEAQIGLLPDLGGTSRLLRLVNTSHAKEISLVGRKVSAETGFRMGFLNGIAESKEGLEKLVQDMIKEILRAAPLTYGLGKKAIDKIYGKSISEGLDETASVSSVLFNSKDFRRGLAAMLEKKEPKWKG